MKKILRLCCLGLLVLSACNSDDGNNSASTSLDGTYVLTAYNVNPSADANNDGNASVNQMNEVDCFTSNRISLSEGINATLIDATYGIDISGTNPSIFCNTPQTLEGWYDTTDGTLRLAYFGEDGFANYLYYDISGNVLTRTITDGQIYTYDASGDVITLSGTISLQYTKQ